MKKVNLGRTGLQVPAIVVGCMRLNSLDVNGAAKYIEDAVAHDVNFFDHADIYGRGLCEELFGKALKMTGIKREDIFVQSKCGILPGVLLAVSDEKNISDDDLVMALFNAAGIGAVIAERACLSGAEGGCQAECGSASAMAASAVCELMGGTPEMCVNAVALTIKFVLGLVCDPVAGLVEVPCVKRNASGAINALTAAELSLSGVESFIPADEVIDAMSDVGKMMSYRLKETALGGLATTEKAKSFTFTREGGCNAQCHCNKG